MPWETHPHGKNWYCCYRLIIEPVVRGEKACTINNKQIAHMVISDASIPVTISNPRVWGRTVI